MKSVVMLLLSGLTLAAQAQEQAVDPVPAPQIAAETSFAVQSQDAPAQLPDVNEQEGADSIVPNFATGTQNQALMLGGLLAMGFMVRRRRDH